MVVGPSITESSVGIRISLMSEVRELSISIRFSFSHETPLSNWGLNSRLSPVIDSIRVGVVGLVVGGVGNWSFQSLQSLSEGHGIFHVHIDIIGVGIGVSSISRREISVVKARVNLGVSLMLEKVILR